MNKQIKLTLSIAFEIFYFGCIIVGGASIGFYVSRHGIEFLNRSAGFIDKFFLNTERGFTEMKLIGDK
jgi:hypothetical protein